MQFGREWTKFAVRFREVSGLESVRLERVDCVLDLNAFRKRTAPRKDVVTKSHLGPNQKEPTLIYSSVLTRFHTARDQVRLVNMYGIWS